MDDFTKLVYQQRPDVIGHDAGSWWTSWGAAEMLKRLQRLGRGDVIRAYEASGRNPDWLRQWYAGWGSKEYPNIWTAGAKDFQSATGGNLADQYSKGGVESAPATDIPIAAEELPEADWQRMVMPMAYEFGRAEVQPYIQRQLDRDLQDYMMGMANVGGGRFGRAWGGTGTLQSEAAQNLDYQSKLMGENMYSGMFQPMYQEWEKQWNKAKNAGNVYGSLNVPTIEEALAGTSNPALMQYKDYTNSYSAPTTSPLKGYGRSLFSPIA